MTKILVTGGGGYVGNVLCRHLLDKGYQVKCVDNFHKGQCDAIIHLATNPNFELPRWLVDSFLGRNTNANGDPFLPLPVITSSKINSIPCLLQISLILFK